jgi:hypothetical protein
VPDQDFSEGSQGKSPKYVDTRIRRTGPDPHDGAVSATEKGDAMKSAFAREAPTRMMAV